MAEEMGGNHGIEIDPLADYAVAGQYRHIVIGVMGALADVRRLEQRAHRRQHLFHGQLFTLLMTHRHVPSNRRFGGEADADQAGLHRIETRGLSIEGKAAGLMQYRQHLIQLFLFLHHRVIGALTWGLGRGRCIY